MVVVASALKLGLLLRWLTLPRSLRQTLDEIFQRFSVDEQLNDVPGQFLRHDGRSQRCSGVL